MSVASGLLDALTAVDWTLNLQSFGAVPDAVKRIEQCNRRIALWAKQLESCDGTNAATPFVRELQVQGHYAAALLGLALYKPSAAAMRSLVESALYYSFFRQHPAELATLVRDPDYFLQKSDVMLFHSLHTADFKKREQALGLVSRLNAWYRGVSAVVHGQIPGSWIGHTSLSKIVHDEAVLRRAITMLEEGEYLVHALFLCTVAQDLWSDFSVPVKKELLKGLKGETKAALGLSSI
jgi:hypothetical protein